jgi:hypothetical protein
MTNSNPSSSKSSNTCPEIILIHDEAIVPIHCYDEFEQMTEQQLEIVFKQIERKRREAFGIRDSG